VPIDPSLRVTAPCTPMVGKNAERAARTKAVPVDTALPPRARTDSKLELQFKFVSV